MKSSSSIFSLRRLPAKVCSVCVIDLDCLQISALFDSSSLRSISTWVFPRPLPHFPSKVAVQCLLLPSVCPLPPIQFLPHPESHIRDLLSCPEKAKHLRGFEPHHYTCTKFTWYTFLSWYRRFFQWPRGVCRLERPSKRKPSRCGNCPGTVDLLQGPVAEGPLVR